MTSKKTLKKSRGTTNRKTTKPFDKFLQLARDPLWQLVSVLVAITIFVFSLVNDSYEDVYIADREYPHPLQMDELIIYAQDCRDSGSISSRDGIQPQYSIVFTTWVSLTFVNPNPGNTGILRSEPIYHSEFQEFWGMNMWRVEMYETLESKQEIDFPLVLPSNVPVRRYFRLFHVAEVAPEIKPIVVHNYISTELQEINWYFEIVGDEQPDLHFQNTTMPLVYEAVSATETTFDFMDECSTLYKAWPFPGVSGTYLSNGAE